MINKIEKKFRQYPFFSYFCINIDMIMNKYLKEQIKKGCSHLVFCFIFLYFFSSNCNLRPATYPYYYKEFLSGVIALTVIYLNYLLLFPKLFAYKKYKSYWFLTFCSVVLSSCLEMIIVYPEVKETYIHAGIASNLTKYILYDTFEVFLRNGACVLYVFSISEILHLRGQELDKENILRKQCEFLDVRDKNHKSGFINIKDIYYCEQEQNMVTIHTLNQDKYYRYCSMKRMEELLGSEEFTRISRNAIVSKRFISKYDDNQLELRKINKFSNNIILSIGDSYKEQIIKQLKLEIGKEDTNLVWEIEKSKKKHRETHTFFPKQRTRSEDFEHNSKLRAVYLHIKSHPGCKVNDICTTCRLPQGTVRRYIGFLMNKRLIQHTGSRRYGGYSVVSQD